MRRPIAGVEEDGCGDPHSACGGGWLPGPAQWRLAVGRPMAAVEEDGCGDPHSACGGGWLSPLRL